MISIGDVYIDKDSRMFNRALRVIGFTGDVKNDKAICEAGVIQNNHFEAFAFRNAKPKISVHRLANPVLFILWEDGDNR